MKQADFLAALKMVSHAAALKDIRYYLNGVFLEWDGVLLSALWHWRVPNCKPLSCGSFEPWRVPRILSNRVIATPEGPACVGLFVV
jgi:hypothetical protein